MSSNIRIERICQYCKESFTAKTTVTKYCSDRCAKMAYKARKRDEKLGISNKETYQMVYTPIEVLKEKPFLSITETTQLMGISRRTLYRMIERGVIKYSKFGRRTIISRAELDEYLIASRNKNN